METQGYEKIGENGGNLWELTRGRRFNHVIKDVKISIDGKSLWITTEKEK